MAGNAPKDGLYAAVALEDESLRSVVVEVREGRLYPQKLKKVPMSFPLAERDDITTKGKQLAAMKVAQSIIKKSISKNILEPDVKFKAIGISSPGIIDVRYKSLVDIPRNNWNIDIELEYLLSFSEIFKDTVENTREDIIVDNDAAMSVLGERWARMNNGQATDFGYVRAGRGINGAVFSHGKPWRGGLHPEIGHIFVKPHPEDRETESSMDRFSCVFHGRDCLEGRAGSERLYYLVENKINSLKQVEDFLCYYIAQLCYSICLFSSPPHIVVTGASIKIPNKESDIISGILRHFFEIKNRYPRRPYLESSKDSKYINSAHLRASEASLRGALYAALNKDARKTVEQKRES